MDFRRCTRTGSVVQRVAAPHQAAMTVWLHALAFTLAALAAALAAVWAPAAAQDRPLTADFPEVYRVGGIDAPVWAQFTGPGILAFDGAGNLYHFDRAASHVLVVDPAGELVRTVGGKGEGPGEFTLPTGLLVWRDGSFAVPDLGHGAYQVFGPQGELERYVRMGEQGILSGLDGMRLVVRPDPGGSALLAQGQNNMFGGLFGGLEELTGVKAEEGTGVDDRGIERIDLGGDVVVTEAVLQGWRVPSPETGEALSIEDVLNPNRLADKAVDAFGDGMYLAPGFHWDVLPDGTIAYSDSSTFEIKLAEAGGASVFEVLRRPHAPEAVTGRIRSRVIEREIREWEQASEELEGTETGNELTDALFSAFSKGSRDQIEKRPFFTEVSVVRRIRAAWDGALWIQRRGDEPWDNDGPIDVFGADREYVGTYDPTETEIPVAFGPDGLAAFWEFDELDVPSIVVVRLPAEVR